MPITDWKPGYRSYPWFIELTPNPQNGLRKHSGADAFQVKSVSHDRFVSRLGELKNAEIVEIAEAIAMCVGAP